MSPLISLDIAVQDTSETIELIEIGDEPVQMVQFHDIVSSDDDPVDDDDDEGVEAQGSQGSAGSPGIVSILSGGPSDPSELSLTPPPRPSRKVRQRADLDDSLPTSACPFSPTSTSASPIATPPCKQRKRMSWQCNSDHGDQLMNLMTPPSKRAKRQARLRHVPQPDDQITAVPAESGDAQVTVFGEGLIRQELQKLLVLAKEHYPSQPILDSEGRVRLTDGRVGPAWKEMMLRAPDYFNQRFRSIRQKEAYGRVVRALFGRIASKLAAEGKLEFLGLINEIIASSSGSSSNVPVSSASG